MVHICLPRRETSTFNINYNWVWWTIKESRNRDDLIHHSQSRAFHLEFVMGWPLSPTEEEEVLRPGQVYSDERVEFSVPPLMASNCHVMKLMFSQIYSLILRTILPSPPPPCLFSLSPYIVSFSVCFLFCCSASFCSLSQSNTDNMWGVIHFLSPRLSVLFFVFVFTSSLFLLAPPQWGESRTGARPFS